MMGQNLSIWELTPCEESQFDFGFYKYGLTLE
jgi:hypothetical protein